MSEKSFSIYVTATQKGGIGKAGSTPWSVLTHGTNFLQIKSSQLSCSTDINKKNVVIMGNKKFNRHVINGCINIILLQSIEKPILVDTELWYVSSINKALELVDTELSGQVDQVFCIGDEEEVFAQALKSERCSTIFMTRIFKEFECDTFLPITESSIFKIDQIGDLQIVQGIRFQFQTLVRIPKTINHVVEVGNAEEQQYIDLVARVIRDGVVKDDRTGTGTKSIFGAQMRFSLRDNKFPLFTSKRVFFRGVIAELLWIITGPTDSKVLTRQNVHIWDGNGSKEFLTKLGFVDREEGDLGPIYHHQFRHFGATYVDCHTDYTGQGVDQLADVIKTIQKDPNDRRLVISAWNPCQLKEQALPACHVLAQFYVANGELSCHMYQRSCDLGLGVPFNVASYSALTIAVAHVCGLKPGEFIHSLGDAHVYLNHIDPIQEQLKRTPRPFPTLRIKRNVPNIDSFVVEDFELTDYNPLPPIKMQMAV